MDTPATTALAKRWTPESFLRRNSPIRPLDTGQCCGCERQLRRGGGRSWLCIHQRGEKIRQSNCKLEAVLMSGRAGDKRIVCFFRPRPNEQSLPSAIGLSHLTVPPSKDFFNADLDPLITFLSKKILQTVQPPSFTAPRLYPRRAGDPECGVVSWVCVASYPKPAYAREAEHRRRPSLVAARQSRSL